MNSVIDIHSHLGDILDNDGDKLIGLTGVNKQISFDIISTWELFLYRRFGILKAVYPLIRPMVVHSERGRNQTATAENFEKSIMGTDIRYSVCLPIPPYVTFGALKEAAEINRCVIPFTGIDCSKAGDFESRLNGDVKNGARGLKLHPNIQKKSYSSSEFCSVVESFRPHAMPVLIHCGSTSYYNSAERHREDPSLGGDIKSAEVLVKAFPDVSFIIGHGGLLQVKEVMQRLSPYKNVRVDTSFQSPGFIKDLISAFGSERVLFGSDWPFGSRKAALRSVHVAIKGDPSLRRRVLYENAAELLGIS